MNDDLITLTFQLLVASMFVEGLIIAVLTIFRNEETIIEMLVEVLPNQQASIAELLLKTLYILTAFFTLVTIFMFLLMNIGIF